MCFTVNAATPRTARNLVNPAILKSAYNGQTDAAIGQPTPTTI